MDATGLTNEVIQSFNGFSRLKYHCSSIRCKDTKMSSHRLAANSFNRMRSAASRSFRAR